MAWLPAWKAAGALCCMRHFQEAVFYLLNTNHILWREIAQAVAGGLDVPPVPLLSWFSLLQKSQMDTGLKNAEKMRRNPAIALLPYLLDSDAEQHKELMGQTIMLSLEKASKVAPQLQDIWIGRQLIAGWVREWRKIGFLPPRSQAATSSRGERGPHCLAWL